MGLLFLVAISSFFLPQFLSYLLDKDHQSSVILAYGKTYKLDAYYQYQRRHHPYGSKIWLASTQALVKNNHKNTLELAKYYFRKNKINQSVFWYLQAIKLGLNEARLPLAHLYFKQNNHHKIKNILAVFINGNMDKNIEGRRNENAEFLTEVLAFLLEVSLIDGDLLLSEKLATQLSEINPDHTVLNEFKDFQVFTVFNERKLTCTASIQFYATTLTDFRKMHQLLKQIENHPLAEFSCFSSVRYIPYQRLQCIHDDEEAITCDESIWKNYTDVINTRFIAILVPKGGAKVHNGIMYLDREDTVDVFAHELAHLLGFIDEYSLPKNHAKCLKPQKQIFSHNISVLPLFYNFDDKPERKTILSQLSWGHLIQESTPIFTKINNGWLLGTPDIFHEKLGIFFSDTCANKRDRGVMNLQSYKPIAQQTLLNYYELTFPKVYYQLLKNNPDDFLMPSFYKNIQYKAG